VAQSPEHSETRPTTGRAGRILVAAASAVCGGANLGLGGAHQQAVLARALSGEGMGGAASFTYDFHFVALVLVGLLLIVPGALCLVHAIGLGRGRRAAWSGALRATVVLVVTNGLLMPVQGFAVLLGAVAAGNLVVLLGGRRRYRAGG
jgi:hypothetical protein